MIALTQVRGSQVSMGAEGGSNALSTLEMDALSRTSVTLLARSAWGFGGVELVGVRNGCVGSKLEISHLHGMHVSIVCRSPSLMLGGWALNA